MDNFIAYGAVCTWWGPKSTVGKVPGTNLPGCPYCGGVLFEVPEPQWLEGIAKQEDKEPGYRAMIEWAHGAGRCWKTYDLLRKAYADREAGVCAIRLEELARRLEAAKNKEGVLGAPDPEEFDYKEEIDTPAIEECAEAIERGGKEAQERAFLQKLIQDLLADSKTIRFQGATTLELPIYRVLLSAMRADFKYVLVLGCDKEGQIVASSSSADVALAVFTMEQFRHNVFSGQYDFVKKDSDDED